MQIQLDHSSKKEKVMGKILKHLETVGALTTWEAIQLYSCTRLSAYIHILKDRGHDITSTWKNQNGKRFTVYELKTAE